MADLKNILAQLPQYDPPDSVWSNIEARLPLLELPQHEPPAAVWENIASVLDEEVQKPVKRLPILRGVSRRLMAIAAACILLAGALISTWVRVKTSENVEKNTVIAQEVLDDKLNVTNFSADDAAFTAVEELCKTPLPSCSTPDFLRLKSELSDLNDAQAQLKNAMGSFNSDADLVVQLTEIENQRSVIVNKMYEMTIATN